MSSLSAGKIQVENLSVAGLGAGAIKATNLKFTNLDVSGNLTVQGAQVATQSFVSSAVQGVIGSAGAALNTLGEIQAALGNDANLASTLTTSIATKANAADVTSSLATKANTADVTSSLATKANAADVTSSLALKANAADVTSSLALKANAADVTSSLATKAPVASPTFTGTATVPNLVVSGNITNASLTALTLQMQNTVMDAESVYYFFGSDDAELIYQPIMEISKDVNRPIYTDDTSTTISQEFITNTSSILPSSGKIMYYPNGVGTPEFPIDGTAGTPIHSGISANIGTPSFVDVTDTSGVYGVALKSIHRKTPLVKNASGVLVGGFNSRLNYSSYNNLEGGPHTEETLTIATQKSLDYYSSRGWGHRAPAYIATDLSGNNIEKNFFLCNYDYNYGGHQAIEFVYPTDSSIVPSSMFLTFYVDDEGMAIGSKYMADQIPDVRTPVSIPVTTDAIIFGQNVIDNANSVFYDINKKQIIINFVVENIWSSSVNIPNFNYSYDNTHTMKSFKGSYAVVKKSQHTFVNNGNSASIFVSCSPTDPEAFLMQISPTISFEDEYIFNGEDWTVTPYTKDLCESTTGNFQGYILTRPGLGNPGTQINAILYRQYVSSYVTAAENPVIAGGIHWGDNPYTTYYEYLIKRARISEWSNEGFLTGQVYLDFDTLATTPESIPLIPISNYRMPNSDTVTDINNLNITIMLHEAYHQTQFGMGAIRLGNTEGEATSMEQDAQIYLDGPSWNIIRSINAFSGYMYSLTRGYQSLTRRGSAFSENDQYSGDLVWNATGSNAPRIPFGRSSEYGESLFYSSIALKYDQTQQILRRKNELSNPLVNKILYENGFIDSNDAWYRSQTLNGSIAKMCYAQALFEVTGLTLAKVYSDFAIGSVFLRNNASIPDKYKTLLPLWIWGSTNTAASILCNNMENTPGLILFPLKSFNFWTDLDRSLPLAPDNYGHSITDTTGALSAPDFRSSDTHTMIPFWPRDASGNDKWSMGTWVRDADGYVTTLQYSTTPYVASRTVVLEDMAMNSYLLPVAGATGLGVSSVMSSISIEVKRGKWDFTVVQFVPDGSGGSWTQLPSTGNVIEVDKPGTWDDASGEVFNDLQTSYLDAAESQTISFDLSGFTVQTYDGFKYYPKLVCVNRGLDGYGALKDIFPTQCRYSGKIVITPTFV